MFHTDDFRFDFNIFLRFLYISVFDLFIGMAGFPHSYLYSSSRAKCFYGMACQEVHVKPGGKLNDLCQVAISRIETDMCNTIIYFIAGIPDICTTKRKKISISYVSRIVLGS